MQTTKFKEKYSYLKGTIYGRLTLTGVTYMRPMYGQLRRIIEADCICGVTREYEFRSLIEGSTKSCGCLRRENVSPHKTHGLSKHPLYIVFQAMKKRCYIATDDNYKNYGGRGIEICDEWLDDFITFYDWSIENGYQSGLSIDRIDNDKDYSPENCRFTNREIQSRNNRRNILITAFGETKCLFDWGKDKRCKVTMWALRSRFERGGWSNMEEMISTPHVDKKESQRKMITAKMITAFGVTKCMTAWLEDKRCVVKVDSLRERFNKGWEGKRILTTPPHSSGKKGIILENIKRLFYQPA